jgi:7-carboxy-7-deazaguanine synthase
MLSTQQINEAGASRLVSLKRKLKNEHLLVHEIFASLQGESSFAGWPCVFVRTTACHLRCSYCDTAHAFHEGRELSTQQVLEKISEVGAGIRLVELTGGEPLLQPASFDLMKRLCDGGKHTVLLETSGAVSIADVDRRVHAIVDVKTPGSGEVNRNIWRNLEILWPACEVKFVICNEGDYQFAKDVVDRYDLVSRCTVLFSPEADNMSKSDLAEWIVRDRLPVRFQIQLHKVLWGDRTGV